MTARTGPSGGIRAFVPALSWLPAYQPAWLRFDLLAALTVWALVVPQAIAYASIAGLPPQTGLFAAAAGLVGYGLLGTSRQLIVSPTSSTAAISASLVTAIAMGDAVRYGTLSSALAIAVGVVFLILGLLKVGFISRFIPTAVQVGFMFALGLTIIVGQLPKILGVPGTEGSFVEQLRQLAGESGAINLPTVALGVAALAALLLGRRFLPSVPMALVVVVGGILAVAVMGLAEAGVAVLGLVEGAVPAPALPRVAPADFLAIVPGAVAISLVGSAESLTVAQQFADEHRDEIRPDQEMIANGGANVLSGLFQGFIVAGGASQSAANDRAGGRSQLVSFVVAAFVVLTSVALLPLFRDLPDAVLGAIVIVAVLGFIRVAELQRLRELRRDSFLIAIIALVLTLALGILPGLIVAVFLSLILLLYQLAKPTIAVLGRRRSEDAWVAVERSPDAAGLPGMLVVRLEAPLLFLNAGLLRDEVRTALAAADARPSVILVDLSMSQDLDVASLDILRRLAERLGEDGTELWLGDVRGPVREMLARSDVIDGASGIRVFQTLEEATAAFGEEGGAR